MDVVASIVNLVSDMSKAQQEAAKAAKEFQRSWQEAIDKVQEGFKSLLEVAGIAVTVDKLKEMALQSIETADQLEKMSQRVGISTESIAFAPSSQKTNPIRRSAGESIVPINF